MRARRYSTGGTVELTSGSLGEGGEARVHGVLQNGNLAAKIYHVPSPFLARKLALMVANPCPGAGATDGHPSLAWPLDLLTDEKHSKRVIGFLMRKAQKMRSVVNVYNPKSRRRNCPCFNYRYLHRVARNICSVIHAVHQKGYCIGDINESNILVSNTALIVLVDTDSFQVRDSRSGKVFRCPVGKPDFTPPELQGKNFSMVDRAIEHDLFGMSVIIFRLLMEGTHPFDANFTGAGEAPSLEARILAGHFAYGTKGVPWKPRAAVPPFEILSPALRQLFIQCFQDGHAHPAKRPNAQKWFQALIEAEKALAQCKRNPQHWYGGHLSRCPWCIRAAFLGRDPFPHSNGNSFERVNGKKRVMKPVFLHACVLNSSPKLSSHSAPMTTKSAVAAFCRKARKLKRGVALLINVVKEAAVATMNFLFSAKP